MDDQNWPESRHIHEAPPDFAAAFKRQLARLECQTAPVPAEGEVAAIEGQPSDEKLLRIAAEAIDGYGDAGIKPGEYESSTESAVEAYGSELCAFARAVLARWGSQQPLRPIPVSERLPGPEDCDLLGHCWWGDAGCDEFVPSWRLCERPNNVRFTHWLPANALPLPEAQP